MGAFAVLFLQRTYIEMSHATYIMSSYPPGCVSLPFRENKNRGEEKNTKQQGGERKEEKNRMSELAVLYMHKKNRGQKEKSNCEAPGGPPLASHKEASGPAPSAAPWRRRSAGSCSSPHPAPGSSDSSGLPSDPVPFNLWVKWKLPLNTKRLKS